MTQKTCACRGPRIRSPSRTNQWALHQVNICVYACTKPHSLAWYSRASLSSFRNLSRLSSHLHGAAPFNISQHGYPTAPPLPAPPAPSRVSRYLHCNPRDCSLWHNGPAQPVRFCRWLRPPHHAHPKRLNPITEAHSGSRRPDQESPRCSYSSAQHPERSTAGNLRAGPQGPQEPGCCHHGGGNSDGCGYGYCASVWCVGQDCGALCWCI